MPQKKLPRFRGMDNVREDEELEQFGDSASLFVFICE